MKIMIVETNMQSIALMLKCWQKGKQWGVQNDIERNLWIENAKGIETTAQGQDLVQDYNDSTGIVYFLACLRNWRGAITVSEVVSNPQLEMEKSNATDAGKIFMNWVSQNSPFTDRQGLGCSLSLLIISV